ncbi:hypothetical protein LINPERHAP2_LOCUS12661 [Linum perenne]
MEIRHETLGAAVGRRMEDIKWALGPTNWLTLNVDGSVDRRNRKATAGGLIRDHEGRCLLAFTMNLGGCSITRAEMRGAIEGLTRAWNIGVR